MRLPGIESYKTQKVVSKTLLNAGPGFFGSACSVRPQLGLFWGAMLRGYLPPRSAVRECATASAMILLHSQARYRKMLVLLLLRRTLIVLSALVLRETSSYHGVP
jgi:hypothetical protein